MLFMSFPLYNNLFLCHSREMIKAWAFVLPVNICNKSHKHQRTPRVLGVGVLWITIQKIINTFHESRGRPFGHLNPRNAMKLIGPNTERFPSLTLIRKYGLLIGKQASKGTCVFKSRTREIMESWIAKRALLYHRFCFQPMVFWIKSYCVINRTKKANKMKTLFTEWFFRTNTRKYM